MKKNILNDVKVIIIILIGVTLLFAILGTFKIKENMEDAPQCYPNVLITEDEAVADAENQKAGYASYKQENNDKYILKTKIIPPKGTACPTEISGPASKYLNGITKSESVSNSSSSDSTSNTSITISDAQSGSTSSSPAPSESQSSMPSLVDHSDTLNEIKGSISQINQQKPKPETCPPCPACERCPEPAFDCKKVPNYRSPAVNQFLPMPILNDFSKF